MEERREQGWRKGGGKGVGNGGRGGKEAKCGRCAVRHHLAPSRYRLPVFVFNFFRVAAVLGRRCPPRSLAPGQDLGDNQKDWTQSFALSVLCWCSIVNKLWVLPPSAMLYRSEDLLGPNASHLACWPVW